MLGINSPELQFQSLAYGGNHQATIEKVARGDASLGAVGSVAYTDYIKIRSNPPVRLIWKSPEIPLGPVLVNKRMSMARKEIITSVLINLHKSHKEAFGELKDGWSEVKNTTRFIPVPDDYRPTLMDQFGDISSLSAILKTFVP